MKSLLNQLKNKLPKKKPHSENYYKRIAFLNKYSLVFHFLLLLYEMLLYLVLHY